MEDLEFAFLTLRIVSGLTGLSQRTLRRWEEKGLLPAGRRPQRAARKPFGVARLYSWREVEQLQQANHLVKGKRLPIAVVRGLLERSQSASLDRDWVIDRPRPKVRGRGRGGGFGASRRFSDTPTRRMR
jgi:DNA-binding transcriptional MerR regulator